MCSSKAIPDLQTLEVVHPKNYRNVWAIKLPAFNQDIPLSSPKLYITIIWNTIDRTYSCCHNTSILSCKLRVNNIGKNKHTTAALLSVCWILDSCSLAPACNMVSLFSISSRNEINRQQLLCSYDLVERMVAAVNNASFPKGKISTCSSILRRFIKAEIMFLQTSAMELSLTSSLDL